MSADTGSSAEQPTDEPTGEPAGQAAEQASPSLGSVAYHAYGDQVRWRNFRDDPMPEWPDLPDPTRAAWQAAADASVAAAAEAQ